MMNTVLKLLARPELPVLVAKITAAFLGRNRSPVPSAHFTTIYRIDHYETISDDTCIWCFQAACYLNSVIWNTFAGIFRLQAMREGKERIICFMSHPWADGIHEFAMGLSKDLVNRGFHVWVDENSMPPGSMIIPAIEFGVLFQSEVFLFNLANSTQTSRACTMELRAARRGAKPIIVIKHEPVTVSRGLFRRLLSAKYIVRPEATSGVTYVSFVNELAVGITHAAVNARLIAVLADGNPDERTEAAKLIAARGCSEALPAIDRATGCESDPTVLGALVSPLERFAMLSEPLRSYAVRILRRLALHEEVFVKALASEALFRLKVEQMNGIRK
jgi:TIR domain